MIRKAASIMFRVATGWTGVGVDMSTSVFPEVNLLISQNPFKKRGWGVAFHSLGTFGCAGLVTETLFTQI